MHAAISRVAGLMVLGLLAGPAIADGPFRCGSKIVDTGMTRAKVLEYCGEPTSRVTEIQDVRSANNRVLGTTEVHRWTYESYSATRVLVFAEEVLQSIE